MVKFSKRLWVDETGATMVEYGLIAALVSLAGLFALLALGTNLGAIYNTVSTTLDDADANPPPQI